MNERTPLFSSGQGSLLPACTTRTTQLYAELALSPGSRCVRLLDLQAAPPGLDDAPLTAHLRVASLADRPVFSTLSYVWGSPASARPWHQITLLPQRVNLAITESCFQALQRIRARVGAVTIWVDSICVNQEDEAEKTFQIPLMMDIYSSARVGYNWLGESNDQLDHAIRRLRSRATISARLPLAYLVSSCQEQREHEWKAFVSRLWKDALGRVFYHLRRASIIDLKQPGQLGADWNRCIKTLRHKGKDLAGIQQLLGHPWTRRAWTFQELVLSRSPVFLCGENYILWEDIINATCLEDHSPELTSALRPWRSLADLWLNLPRLPTQSLQSSDPEIEAFPPLPSFRELLDRRWLQKLRMLREVLHSVVFLTTICIYAASAGIIIVLARQQPQEIVSPKMVTDSRIIYGAMFFICLSFPFLFGIIIPTICGFLSFILIGKLPAEQDAHHENHPLESLLLNGVWTALAQRASSEPRDKFFALSGILKAMGASPSLPNYSWTVRETYHNLFRVLLAWQPTTASVMLSAGLSDHGTDWPSWLPNWTVPERNTWLVDRYRADHTIHAAPIRSTLNRRPVLIGDKLVLSGQYIGTVEICVRLGAITSVDDRSQLLHPLHQLAQWMRSVTTRTSGLEAYTVIQSSLFSILEGLSRPKQNTMAEYTFWDAKVKEWRTIEYTKKRWEAPYDFIDCLDEFKAFEAFHQIIHRPDSRTEEAMLSKLQGNRVAFDYFVRTVNRLAGEERGLFVLTTKMAGSGSLEMVEGDTIYLAAGVRAPILLRGTSTLRYVSPVLVHGIMHGEQFREGELDTVELQ
ncbi:heterokaryon incompatibility protein-domain-containing protein [Lasiosphaeris hirsuta]|uniref:Heterokaryon incompatibility protein-domain-containing protein n=1 Tax=Lasiosphaeris hirsuta TaxID=260670 RepID=A0AA40EAM4_9PEZI|nr:heterokaryon incompatibility protein-domain-containing protein [Lasiosphaeris hirsuta]